MIICKCCGQRMLFPEAGIMRQFYNGKCFITYHFCGQTCLQDWYISNLNTVGM